MSIIVLSKSLRKRVLYSTNKQIMSAAIRLHSIIFIDFKLAWNSRGNQIKKKLKQLFPIYVKMHVVSIFIIKFVILKKKFMEIKLLLFFSFVKYYTNTNWASNNAFKKRSGDRLLHHQSWRHCFSTYLRVANEQDWVVSKYCIHV